MQTKTLLIRGGQVYAHEGDVHKPIIADILIRGDAIAGRVECAVEGQGLSEIKAATSAPPILLLARRMPPEVRERSRIND